MNEKNFLEVFVLAERLHRQFLEVIRLELDDIGVRDLNNVRALILLNIGKSEMTASELLWRGCYLGSNIAYNLRKLTEAGYILQTRSTHDKRVIMVRNSNKGEALCARLNGMNARQVDGMIKDLVQSDELEICRKTLRNLQQFWSLTSDIGAPFDMREGSDHDGARANGDSQEGQPGGH